MRILILAQHYAPEDVSGAVLAVELATDLANRGNLVSFVTAAPSYPQGRVFSGYRNSLLSRENLDHVKIVRVWSYISPDKSFWRRLINYGTFGISALFGGLAAGKPDVLMSVSPPFPLGISAWLLSRLWGIPWVYRVEDLFPDAAIAMGVLKNHIAISLFYWIERFFYRKATHISVISPTFREILIHKGVSPKKISVLPVWADPDAVRPNHTENQFRTQHKLGDNFLVLYAGNLGYTSSLEDVILAADILKDETDIILYIVGEGVKKENLLEMARMMNLNNVHFLPFQPRDEFANMLAAAQVGLLTLNRESSNTSLPSKLFNIMSCERPVMAIASEDSDVARLINEAQCGMVVPPGKPELLAQAILELKNNPSRMTEMGQNGRAKILSEFNRNECINKYERTFQNAIPDFHGVKL